MSTRSSIGGRWRDCRSYAASLWYLGYPDQGLARSQEAVTLAQPVRTPRLANALSWGAVFHQFCREGHAAQECAGSLHQRRHGSGVSYWRAYSSISRGWALVHQGQGKEGRADAPEHASLSAEEQVARPYVLALLAEA